MHQAFGYEIEYLLYDLDMITGWLLYSWAFSNDALNRFGGLKMVTSPQAVEADRLLYQLREYLKEQHKD